MNPNIFQQLHGFQSLSNNLDIEKKVCHYNYCDNIHVLEK